MPYYATGGGGGELPRQAGVDYHFLAVTVGPAGVRVGKVSLPEKSRPPLLEFWKYLWFQIHAWFYVAWLNFFLGLALVWLILFTLYTKLAEQVDYYPPLNLEPTPPRKLTIVMFTNNYFPFVGGVPIAIHRLKKGLERLGHRVYIFAPRYDRQEAEEENIIRCRPLFQYRKGNFVVPVTNIFSTRIAREFARLAPDVVHLHHPYWLGHVGQKLARRHGLATVYTYHTRLERLNHYLPLFRGLAGGRIPHMLIKHFANLCDAIIAPTMTAKSYLRNLGVGKTIAVLPTGVDLDAYRHEPEEVAALHAELGGGRLVLLSVFRLSAEKNPYFFLEGIDRLRQVTTIPFRCVIAGDGPERDKMTARIAELGLQEEVRLLGNVPPAEIALYYQAADLFVFASQAETQGLVVLEAMAGGCPVVAVAASGVADVIRNGRNGFATEATVAAWSARIAELLADDARRRQLASQAREDARQYSLEAMAAQVVSLYGQVRQLKGESGAG
ncbi:MAG: glycosyltransferase [Deltaproteobacteria bacterium]|nr:glycosyltransferase [Deltaproteobacteria bacterium]